VSFQDNPNAIRWRLHLISPVERVYQALSTDAGRASFWAESAVERDNVIHFIFPNKVTWNGKIIQADPPHTYALHYYGNSITTFVLEETSDGGTDLLLTDTGITSEDRTEVISGWVSVLMNLKAAVDFGVDLRVHDADRNWDSGYVEN
jgi:uncharacterized protein YndB with AHSA1/START domain